MNLKTATVLFAAGSLLAQNSHLSRIEANYRSAVLPLIEKNCIGCHSDALRIANLNLERYRDSGLAVTETGVWDRVLEKVSTGRMPPAGRPALSKADVAAIRSWTGSLPGHAAEVPDGDPGRVTARRLNRVEYNNTVRDLLGVGGNPADKFPVDDAGYGFDNNGDVLTLSPLLMEKYMAAARRIAQTAVFGEPYPAKPGMLAVLMPKKGADAPANSASAVILPYSIRGGMSANLDFPVDAEYEFRVRVINHRDTLPFQNLPRDEYLVGLEAARHRRGGAQEGAAKKIAPSDEPKTHDDAKTHDDVKTREEKSRLAFPPVRLVLTLDGSQILEGFIEGNTDYQYDRGAFIVRVPVEAGQHALRASFPEFADLDDPRRNINPDFRRRLYVEYTEIAGPFHPSAAPPESYRRIFVCGHLPGKHTAACMRRIIPALAERAYRKPVTAGQLDQLTGLVKMAQRQGDSFEEGIKLAVQAILMSPEFLFRSEAGAGARGARPIGEYELASRLSYFLWSSMPDDELLGLARSGELRRTGVVEAQVRRMLADPKASALVENFAGQWLGIRSLERKAPDPDRFPTTDDELVGYMHRETNLFVAAMFREDRSILDFIDAPFTYVNGPLARHYGIDGVKGEEFQRVELSGPERSGVLTQGSVLATSSFPTRTSVVTRGRWVLENLLGAAPPPPPPDVPSLVESDIGASASLRQKMEQHRSNPACAACHVQMDPIGFGLENYDAAGSWRTHDGRFPIDASGTLPGGKSFDGAAELKKVLRSRGDEFARTFTEKLLTYALGRGLESYDQSAVQEISKDLAAHGYRFSTLVMDIVNSRAFQMRTGEVN